MTSATEVLIGLGSNLEQPSLQVTNAIQAIALLKNVDVIAQSSLYQSAPQGPQDQNNFCNAVILVRTNLPPKELLIALQEIECAFGRVKKRYWGERIIDLDILFYGQQEIRHDTPDLTIPHLHALTRDFVIIPALEIAPDWELPDGSLLQTHKHCCLKHQLIKLRN